MTRQARTTLTTAALAGLLLAPAALGKTRASSEAPEHPASHAFDGLLQTSWAEGEDGEGEGAWIEVDLGKVLPISSVSIWPGDLSQGERTIREVGRPMDITITLTGGDEEVTVTKHILDPGEDGALRLDVDVVGTARTVRVTADKVYRGGIRSDMHIAEVAINFAAGELPPSVQGVKDHLASDKGKELAEASRAEVVALFERSAASEFGDRDALQELMARASEGPPFLREIVAKRVEDGFRATALTPDEVAIEALLKLKDSNAIPAIDRAGLRLVGGEARRMAAVADKFRAYQDLVGGPRRNIAAYGEPGWEKGALQGFGEPLDILVDDYGSLYVADTANNRVQQFDQNGVFSKAWCKGEPDVTDRWFGTRRDYYVTACPPSKEQGGFVNPVSLALFPGKLFDTIAVLDAAGRVSLIGEGGNVVRVIDLPVEGGLAAGVGGEGHILNVKDRIVVVFSNEGFVYDLDGTERARFDIEGGAPTGAVPLGGKIGLIHGKRLDLYSLDGFFFGDVLRGSLGRGYEAWDITLDEKGKLWAVTDKGEVFKLKKPSSAAWQVKVTEVSFQAPRIDVIDGMAYITDRNKILKADVLQLEAEAREAAKAGKGS